ncbi:sugar phosphatase [Enterobacterales bacterium CwR94]|nr:sugar phosphatase [Enterobacterales bacterium CwR94]
MTYKGFLFDLDGTLVDSLPMVERAWIQWGARHGYDAETILAFIHGKPAITSLRHFLAGKSEEEIQREFLALEKTEAEEVEGIVALPGAVALLARLNELHIPWGIVTSGSVPVAHARHKAAGLPMPEVFVTAERIKIGKPDPEPYLLGAELLGVPVEQCIVVEDAAAGILSGLAAGSFVIGVNVPADAPRLADVHLRLDSLANLQVAREADGSVALSGF